MPFLAAIVIAAVCFGVFWLIDKGFTKLFRSQVQHQSGLAIRLNKRYCSFGLILCVLGVSCLFAAGTVMLIAGIVILLVGIAMVVYYMTFGVFYDDDGFVLTTFGKKSTNYRYEAIKGQMLYTGGGNVIVELHMNDGRTVQLPVSMEGVYDFLDTAFAGWLIQTKRTKESCDFYDPDNSCWFPGMEG